MRVVLCHLLLYLLAAPAFADDAPFGSCPGVLLLRNGSVIEGTILREGDRYEVKLEDGDLRVRADDVEFVGRTLDECYRHQLAGIDGTRAQDHLELAEWCVRNGLHAAAGRELREAMIHDPRHPMIGVLERRLKLAIETPRDVEPVEPRQLSAPTTDELDRMVDGMPPGTVETFTTVIQPMLVNQCSTAGCHGPASTNSLRLMRVSGSRTPSRRATQRNLYAALQNTDTENPDNSPLLTMPIRAHGTSRAAVFTNRQTQQYRQLVDWVYSVSTKRPTRKPASQASSVAWPVAEPAQSKPTAKPPSEKPTSSPTVAAKYLQQQEEVQRISAVVGTDTFDGAPAKLQLKSSVPATEDETDLNATSTAPGQLSRRILPGHHSSRTPPKRGESEQTPPTTDPFDPDQFNRQQSAPQRGGQAHFAPRPSADGARPQNEPVPDGSQTGS